MDVSHDACPPPPVSGERPLKRRRTADPPNERLAREVGFMRSLPSDKFSSFVGSASGIYFIRSVYEAIRRSNPNQSAVAQTPESDAVPGEDDYLPTAGRDSSAPLWKDYELIRGKPPHISFQNLVDWSGSYFANWHVAYPFLHAPTLLSQFEQLSRDPDPQRLNSNQLDMVIVRSIMSISLADRRQDGTLDGARYPVELTFQSYDEAIESLNKVLSQATSLLALQAAMSVQLFLISMLRFKAAARLGGLIIRMALQLGLHRCPNRFPTFSIAERELRQRMFWSLYCMDRHICQAMGLPLSLRDDDIDVCYPIQERHSTEQPTADHRLRLLTMLVRHSEIRSQIMELRNKSIYHEKKETDEGVVITGKLVKWWNDVEDIIDTNGTQEQAIKTYHMTVLTILKHELTISMNRPILAAAHHGPTYHTALQHCIGASRAIITTLHKCIEDGQNSNNPLGGPTLFWPSFTWAVWMSAFVLFYAANTREVSQSVVSRLADKSLAILHHLSRRGSVWPDACAAAIRDLYVQMMKPPVANVGTGQSPEQSFADGAGHQPPHQRTTQPPVENTHNVSDSTTPATLPSQSPAQGERPAEWRPPAPTFPQSASQTGVFAHPNVTSQPSHTPPYPDQRPGSTNPHRLNSASLATPPNGSNSNLGFPPWEEFVQNGGTFDPSLPLPGDGADPFVGFDIPFWLGQDQYAGVINEWG